MKCNRCIIGNLGRCINCNSMPFEDSKEGQTHHENDGHNHECIAGKTCIDTYRKEWGKCCIHCINTSSLKEQIDQAREEERKKVLEQIKNLLQSRLMNYDTKDGYSSLYDQVLEHLSDEVDRIIENLLKHEKIRDDMQIEIPKCNSCEQPMFEIDGIGKDTEIVDTIQVESKTPEGLTNISYRKNVIGVREMKLYQCLACRDVKIY